MQKTLTSFLIKCCIFSTVRVLLHILHDLHILHGTETYHMHMLPCMIHFSYKSKYNMWNESIFIGRSNIALLIFHEIYTGLLLYNKLIHGYPHRYVYQKLLLDLLEERILIDLNPRHIAKCWWPSTLQSRSST